MNEPNYDLSSPRKAFSRIGLAFCTIVAVTTVLQVLWILIPRLIWGKDNWIETSSWGMWLGTLIPSYCVAIPIGLYILRKLPAQKPQTHKLGFGKLLVLLPICVCLMYGGNWIGTLLSSLLSGGTAENAVLDYAMDTNPLKVVAFVILIPLVEEYVCRKQLIDRTRQYGEKTAVFLSALIFGLLHQNLFQFFYAFALGLVFGYIYLRTGRLRYSVALHGFVNFLGSVVAPWVLSQANVDAMANLDPNASPEQIMAVYQQILPSVLLVVLYAFLLLGMFIAGLVLLIILHRRVIWKEADTPLPKRTVFKTVYLNAGMVLYVLLCIASFFLALL
jgi:membrane protease YdiL (CAAX protease family)